LMALLWPLLMLQVSPPLFGLTFLTVRTTKSAMF
jgi:hypothetical protein